MRTVNKKLAVMMNLHQLLPLQVPNLTTVTLMKSPNQLLLLLALSLTIVTMKNLLLQSHHQPPHLTTATTLSKSSLK